MYRYFFWVTVRILSGCNSSLRKFRFCFTYFDLYKLLLAWWLCITATISSLFWPTTIGFFVIYSSFFRWSSFILLNNFLFWTWLRPRSYKLRFWPKYCCSKCTGASLPGSHLKLAISLPACSSVWTTSCNFREMSSRTCIFSPLSCCS